MGVSYGNASRLTDARRDIRARAIKRYVPDQQPVEESPGRYGAVPARRNANSGRHHDRYRKAPALTVRYHYLDMAHDMDMLFMGGMR